MLTDRECERFWSKVDKERSKVFYNGTRCWEWNAGRDHGYGYFYTRTRGTRRAHRVAYEISYGEIKDGLLVCHHCDNRPCVNPSHLFLGTYQDNATDRNNKGIQVRGESHGIHKLTAEQVDDIRRRYARHGRGGENSTELAREFGISHTQVFNIVKNIWWKE